jgi:hypothetical protein
MQRVYCHLFSPEHSDRIISTYEPEAPRPPATQVAEAVDQLREVFTLKMQLETEIQPGAI